MSKVVTARMMTPFTLLGDFVRMILGLILAAVLGWKLLQYFRSPSPEESKATAPLVDETP